MKERKRGQGMVYVKFALIIVAAALVGGVVGYGAAANEDLLPAAIEALDRFLVWVGPWWFAPVYLALILGTAFYLRGRALLPQAEEDDGAFQRADRQLSLGLVFTGAAIPGMLTAMGLAFAAAGEEPAWMLASAGLLPSHGGSTSECIGIGTCCRKSCLTMPKVYMPHMENL